MPALMTLVRTPEGPRLMLDGLTQATVVHNPHVPVVVPIDVVHGVWQVDFEGHLVGIRSITKAPFA